MQKLKELWSSWRGTIGFVGGALVVSTTYFTCTLDPNEEAIKEKALEQVAPKEDEEAKKEVEPIPVEKVEEVEGSKEAKEDPKESSE